MPDFTITLTDTENKAMEYCAADVDDWITNAATNRAHIAIKERHGCQNRYKNPS